MKAGRTRGRKWLASAWITSAGPICSPSMDSAAVWLPRSAIRSRSALRCRPAASPGSAATKGFAPSLRETATATTKRPGGTRLVAQGTRPRSARPSAPTAPTVPTGVASTCRASMPPRYFMALDRPVAPACVPCSRPGSQRWRSAALGDCSRYSTKARCAQNTKPAVSECPATPAMASSASPRLPPCPPSATGTPRPNRPCCASRGSTSCACAGPSSRESAWASSHCRSESASMCVLLRLSELFGQIGLQLRVDGALRQAVGKVAQRGQADAQHHLQCLLLAQACCMEGGQGLVGDGAARGDHGFGKAAHGVQARLARVAAVLQRHHLGLGQAGLLEGDRKSTRLNSSHLVISYAVF